MATSQLAMNELQTEYLYRIEGARARTDALFSLLPPNSFYDRPIPERHRLIFYLGHFEAVDWNLPRGPLGLAPHAPDRGQLFALAVDPLGGVSPTDLPSDWPNIARIEKYNSGIRNRLDGALRDPHALRLAGSTQLNTTLLHGAIG